MSNLTDKDIDRIVKALASKNEFYIEPEQHYLDHKEWAKAQQIWATGSRLFWVAFLGFAVLGAIVLMAVGLVSSSDLTLLKKMMVISK